MNSILDSTGLCLLFWIHHFANKANKIIKITLLNTLFIYETKFHYISLYPCSLYSSWSRHGKWFNKNKGDGASRGHLKRRKNEMMCSNLNSLGFWHLYHSKYREFFFATTYRVEWFIFLGRTLTMGFCFWQTLIYKTKENKSKFNLSFNSLTDQVKRCQY